MILNYCFSMRWRLKVLLLALICIPSVVASKVIDENSRTDSLLQLIAKAKNDSGKVSLYLDLRKSYSPEEVEEGLSSARSAYFLAAELNFTRGIMLAGYELGKLYKSSANYDSAMYYFQTSLRLSDSLRDYKLLAKNYNECGSLLRRKGYYSSALEYHQKSYQASQRIHDSLGIANASVYSAIVHELNTDYDTAVASYYSALRMYEAMGDKRNMGIALLNIGDLNKSLHEPDKALNQFRTGLLLFKEINDLLRIGLAYNKIGTVQSDKENYDSALYYYNKCKPYYDSIGNNSGLAHLNINIGNVFFNKDQYAKAEAYYNKAIDAFRVMGYQRGLKNAIHSMAKLYWKQGKTGEALEMYFQCEHIAREVDQQSLVELYSEIVEIYKAIGNSDKALEYQEMYSAVKDSIYQREKVLVIADTEMKYEKEKDQARILAMEKETLEIDVALERRTRQRNTYLFSGTGVVLILIFLLSYFSQRTRKNRIISEQRIKQLEEEKKLLAARSIVVGQEEERKRIARELHDGLGVLLSSAKMHFTTVRDKSPESKSLIDKAAQLLEQASGDVRRISHNMMPGLLTKYGFYEAVEDLFEQVNEMEEVHATVKIDGNQARLNENTEIMLYRIIQEMVNNTLKHAEAKNAQLKIDILPGTIALNYLDDGKGFKMEDKLKLKSKSMGLTSIQSRTKFLNGKIDFHSETGKGSSYDIRIPLVSRITD